MIKRCLPALALVVDAARRWRSALGSPESHGALRRTSIRPGGPPRRRSSPAAAMRNSLAAAAALSFVGPGATAQRGPGGGQAAPWIWPPTPASSIPTDPSIGWLRLQLCASTAGCDIRDAATTMRWVDADNGAVWLPTLAAAQKDKDPVGGRPDPCRHGPRSSRFDFYWNPTVVLLFDGLKQARAAICRRTTVPSDLGSPQRGDGGRRRRDRAAARRAAECLPRIRQRGAARELPQAARSHARGDTVVGADGGPAHREAPVARRTARRRARSRSGGGCWSGAMASANLDDVPVAWLRNAMAREPYRRDAGRAARGGRRHRDPAKARLPLEPPEESTHDRSAHWPT